MIRTLVLLAALASLSACGFRPLYAGQGQDTLVDGKNIAVAEITGRSGYLLRQQLIRSLATGLPGLEEKARLTVRLDESFTRATLLPDGAVSRSFYNATGKYVLQTGDQSLRGQVTVQVPYAAARTPYSDISAQNSTPERAMDELARRIVENLRIQAQQDS